MNPSARYVVSTGAFERLTITGPLTDRRIAHYERQGYYGRQAQARAVARENAKNKPTLKELLSHYK
jgi:hypothetical protein